ncbi:MAG: epoxyqueuosine reductase QueH [Desulfovibrionaceae bacterium]|nr:epoxyqueuosine reductase QueH [Desulfovibrionaceae bacterium]
MPIVRLREEGFVVTAFFFNPNIHPQDEYLRRRDAMRQASERLDVPVLWEPEAEDGAVNPVAWVQALNGDRAGGIRCRACYRVRVEAAARLARAGGFDAFCTSLLYSRYQHHEDIVTEAETAAHDAGVPFLYRDFRPWWQDGITMSKEMGLYRQKWCGCILSKGEAERQRAERQAARAAKAARITETP